MAKSTKANQQESEFEQLRAEVMSSELIARANKAEYEKMYYYIEANKIAPTFTELLDKVKTEREQLQKDFEEQLKVQIEAQNTKQVNVTDEVTTGSPVVDSVTSSN